MSIKEKESKKLLEKITDLENRHKRAVADYQNLVKRTEDDKEKYIKFASVVLILSFLEILDDLEASQSHLNNEGLEKIVTKFKKILDQQGVKEIIAKDEIFNPEFHEAIESVEGENGRIIKVHRKGYLLGEKIIRPALVAVGKS